MTKMIQWTRILFTLTLYVMLRDVMCVYVCMYVCMCVRMCAANTHTCACMHTSMFVRVRVLVWLCVHACISVCLYESRDIHWKPETFSTYSCQEHFKFGVVRIFVSILIELTIQFSVFRRILDHLYEEKRLEVVGLSVENALGTGFMYFRFLVQKWPALDDHSISLCMEESCTYC
jgi:hypothetical protein